jgi:hypothetical protein
MFKLLLDILQKLLNIHILQMKAVPAQIFEDIPKVPCILANSKGLG